jgi:hypothetical protein
MTTAVILLIGRNPVVLGNLAAALEEEGFLVRTTDLVEQASIRFNAVGIDLVAFGRGVDAQTNAQLRADFGAQNPDVLFVDGLAPVISLLVKQIKRALAGHLPTGPTLSQFSCAPVGHQWILEIAVANACRLTIDLYQLDAVHTTQQHTLVAAQVAAGMHSFSIDRPAEDRSTIHFLAASTDDGELLVLNL